MSVKKPEKLFSFFIWIYESMIETISKIQYAFKTGGLKTFASLLYGYLETRLLVLMYMFIPTPYLTASRDAAGIKIIKKQAGDIDSIEMLEFLIPEINNIRSEKYLNIVLPRYLLNAFSLASAILANGKVHFSPVDESIHDPDFILCSLLMINQVSPEYSRSMKNMEICFKNNSYVIFCKTGLVDSSISKYENINDYVSVISKNKRKGVKLYVKEDGFNFVVREGTMDRAIINEVKHEYLDRLVQCGFTGKNVIDLGAHIGSFSIQIAKYLQPDAKIICFEPSPYNVNMIKENIELNKLGGVINVQQSAVSSKPGKATLFLSSDNTGGNKLDMVEPSSEETVEVEVTTLSDIVAEFGDECVDLLKIDVEGSEHPILFPHGDLLKKRVKLIIGEAGGSAYGNGEDIVKFLQSHEFEVDYTGNAAQLIFYAKNKSLA